MLHEFAVEPEAIAESWETFRYIFEKFSADRGLVISRFPKRWARQVYDATDGRLGWLDRQRVQEKLARGQKDVVPFGRAFDSQGGPWRDQALASHTDRPFTGVVVTEVEDEDALVLIPSDLDDTFFACARETDCPRRAAEIVDVLKDLLVCSSHVMLVDQYFDPTRRKWRNPLAAILQAAKAGSRPCHLVEFHIRWRDPQNGDGRWQDQFEQECRRNLSSIVPQGMRLRVVRWDDSESTNKLHERYVLTDVAGVAVDPGLDESVEDDTTRLALMAHETWVSRKREFSGESDLRLVDDVTILGA